VGIIVFGAILGSRIFVNLIQPFIVFYLIFQFFLLVFQLLPLLNFFLLIIHLKLIIHHFLNIFNTFIGEIRQRREVLSIAISEH